jgi:hypothetical protein
MKLYVLDAESYYDREYSLKRLDPASYILTRLCLRPTRRVSAVAPIAGS